jgi:hypothetical protein
MYKSKNVLLDLYLPILSSVSLKANWNKFSAKDIADIVTRGGRGFWSERNMSDSLIIV